MEPCGVLRAASADAASARTDFHAEENLLGLKPRNIQLADDQQFIAV
jgi:hypothetical protein